MTLAILAVWMGVGLLSWLKNDLGIFAPLFATIMSVLLFLIGFGKKA